MGVKADRGHGPLPLVVASSAWIAVVGNMPLWLALRRLGLLDSGSGCAMALALALTLGGCTVAFLSLLSWRPTLKPAATLLLLATATSGYFMLAYQVVIDPGMMTNVVETDVREAADLWSPWLAAYLVLVAGPPVWAVWTTRLRRSAAVPQLLRNLAAAAGGIVLSIVAILTVFQPLASAMRNHKELRYMMSPFNSLYAASVVASRPFTGKVGPLLPVGRDASFVDASTGKPPLLVLVLGETARSVNFGLNGYARDTTPELAALGVASFTNAWSCGTSTAASLPCMFSHLGRQGFAGLRQPQENLLDVLHHAGLAVLWVDNQAGCKGICDRVPSARVTSAAESELCRGGECLDGMLLEGLEDRIQSLPADRRARGAVLVLHQMGSHGPAYWRRSPAAFKRYLPECPSASLQECSREQVVNSYDNSIAYTDAVLASVIGWLKQRSDRWDTAMIYVSDHGESLGENNLYLHGLPYAIAPDVQKHVPWITWLSEGFERRAGLSMECLQRGRRALLTHENYFHSVVGLLDVRTSVYSPALDAYSQCTQSRRKVDEGAPGIARPSHHAAGLPAALD